MADEITITMSETEEDIRKLYDASKMGSIQILNTLLQDDPNIIKKFSMISTSNNETLLHVSVSHGHLEFTRVLLDHSPELVVEVDDFQRTPLHIAATNGYLEIVKAVLERNTSACLVRDQEGLIPLHCAVINKRIEVIQELINANLQSVWMMLKSGRTILHLCVEGNHLEGIKLLTQIVANHDKDFLNTIDDAGNTILDLSLKLKQIEMVEYLLSNPEVKTGSSITNSIGRKRSLKLRKKMSKKSRRGQETVSSSIKKKREYLGMFKDKLKYKGDWAEEVQNMMMLVATVIATVTFQAGINPPGGVWQQDTPHNATNYLNNPDNYYIGYGNGYIFSAGTAIMWYREGSYYSVYSFANTVSFMASASVIMLIISGFPVQNRIGSALLSVSMFLAVFFMTLGYVYGALMVSFFGHIEVIVYVFIIWLGIVCLIALWRFLCILVWVVKSLCRVHPSKLRSKASNITTLSTK